MHGIGKQHGFIIAAIIEQIFIVRDKSLLLRGIKLARYQFGLAIFHLDALQEFDQGRNGCSSRHRTFRSTPPLWWWSAAAFAIPSFSTRPAAPPSVRRRPWNRRRPLFQRDRHLLVCRLSHQPRRQAAAGPIHAARRDDRQWKCDECPGRTRSSRRLTPPVTIALSGMSHGRLRQTETPPGETAGPKGLNQCRRRWKADGIGARVRFRVTANLDCATECNCSICTKKDFFTASCRPGRFQLSAARMI